MIRQIILRPWAKINLYLKILGKRSDGYHNILTLIHPIALFDELAIKIKTSAVENYYGNGLVLNCKSRGLPKGQDLPSASDNIITRAATLFFNYIKEKPLAKIDILKRIPIGGGLGGGSSDAASCVSGLNEMYGQPLDKEKLHKLCADIGMDVPFFLEPHPASCGGRGEIIKERYNNAEFFCVLINPGVILPTKDVYRLLNLPLTEGGTKDNIFNFAKMNDIYSMSSCVYNDLEAPAIRICPEISVILKLLRDAGALKSFVCGSGSTVCGLTESKEKAEEVMGRVKIKGSKKWWYKTAKSLY